MNRRRTLKILIPVLLIVAWLCMEIGSDRWHISVICPRCLQHAYVQKRTIFGVTVWKSTQLNQNPGGIMSSAAFSPGVPQISPRLYDQIFGQQCSHVFKKGGFGRTNGFLLTLLHADGSYVEWHRYTQRTEAIESLYVAFTNTGAKELGRETYMMIDMTFPLDEDLPLDGSERVESEAVRIARAILFIESVTRRLKQVTTEDQWRDLLVNIEKDLVLETR